MSSKYTVIRFKNNPFPLIGKRTFVAVIEHVDYPEQPFRVVIENAGSVEEARKDVEAWIKCREVEDENALADAKKTEEAEASDEILLALNI